MNLTQWRALPQQPVDRAVLYDILVNKIKLKREPVAVTYCEGEPPAGYAPARVPVCSILHHAEQGKKILVNAQQHDCYVGQYHLGFLPHEDAGSLICDGEYLTMAQGFFTQAAAKRNKHESYTLPPNTINAIAAAPLRDLDADVPMDLLCIITDVQRAMQIAGAASVREGTFPHGELGPSSCSSLFAAPWHTQNTVFALGEGGGRGFNQVASSEMFVALPAHHVPYVIEMFQNFWFKPDEMRKLMFPSHAERGT
jgi:uncharacterized protein (DUF169 family)